MPPVLIKALSGAAALVILVFISFQWGRADQRGDYLEEMAELQKEYAAKVQAASADAYSRGLAAGERKAVNREIANDLSEAAHAEAGADDLCWSADVYERLRSLQ